MGNDLMQRSKSPHAQAVNRAFKNYGKEFSAQSKVHASCIEITRAFPELAGTTGAFATSQKSFEDETQTEDSGEALICVAALTAIQSIFRPLQEGQTREELIDMGVEKIKEMGVTELPTSIATALGESWAQG